MTCLRAVATLCTWVALALGVIVFLVMVGGLLVVYLERERGVGDWHPPQSNRF